MNKKPVSYLQTDSKWKSLPYRVPGETATIGSSGCGPTCAAMVIATMKNPAITPVETCKWSIDHGYKALKQGTYYSYFKPQLAAYGIECKQLLGNRILNQPNHTIHEQVKKYLSEGYYVIALMGPGNWTSGGHFILLYGWDDKVRINDPASTKDRRLNGDPATFRNEVRNYWLVDARTFNKEDEEVTQDQFDKMMDNWLTRQKDIPPAEWSQEDRAWAEEKGLIAGDTTGKKMYRSFCTREQMVVFLHRLVEKLGL